MNVKHEIIVDSETSLIQHLDNPEYYYDLTILTSYVSPPIICYNIGNPTTSLSDT